MKKDDLVYVGYMVTVARSIMSKVAGKSRSEFDADEILQLALAHLVQTLGELAECVSPEFEKAYSEVPWKKIDSESPWKKIVDMRRKARPDYLHVDYNTIWNVATAELPPLLSELERIARHGPQNPP